MTEEEEELARRSLARWRDGSFAGLVTVIIGLAAETHPEEIRQALSKVFDMKAAEEACERVMRLASAAAENASRARDRIERAILALERAEKRLAELEYRAEKLEKILGKPGR